MALPAKLGPLYLQQKFVGGAVWVVAIEAIFTNRRVFPKEWTTLLSMALVAIVVHRIFTQHGLGGTAVRVMAIRTSDLAFTQRHVGRKVRLRASVFMTLEAGVPPSGGVQLEFSRHLLHDGVTVRAHQAARLVRAAVPISPVAAFVTGKTDGIVLFGRARWIVRPERDDAANATPTTGLHVRRPRTVAVLAIELAFLRHPYPAHERMLE